MLIKTFVTAMCKSGAWVVQHAQDTTWPKLASEGRSKPRDNKNHNKQPSLRFQKSAWDTTQNSHTGVTKDLSGFVCYGKTCVWTWIRQSRIPASLLGGTSLRFQKSAWDTTQKSHTGVTKDLSGFVCYGFPPCPIDSCKGIFWVLMARIRTLFDL